MKYLGEDYIAKDGVKYYTKLDIIATLANSLDFDNILITGIGDGYLGTVIRGSVTYVEIDKKWNENTDKSIINADAEEYVREHYEKYDLIIINHHTRGYSLRALNELTNFLSSKMVNWISYFDNQIIERFLSYSFFTTYVERNDLAHNKNQVER